MSYLPLRPSACERAVLLTRPATLAPGTKIKVCHGVSLIHGHVTCSPFYAAKRSKTAPVSNRSHMCICWISR